MSTPSLHPTATSTNDDGGEQRLSQRLSQLSTLGRQRRRSRTLSPTEWALSKTVGMHLESTPAFLAKTHPSLEQKIRSIQPPIDLPLDDLRAIAILMYRLLAIDLVRSLWIVYRQSGTGNLPSNLPGHPNVDTRIWPVEVQANMHDDPLAFVNRCLHTLDVRSEAYRSELRTKTGRWTSYTRSLECSLEQFVQHGLGPLRLEIDRHIAVVHYHHADGCLKRAYQAQKPNQSQVHALFFFFFFVSRMPMPLYSVDARSTLSNASVSSSTSKRSLDTKSTYSNDAFRYIWLLRRAHRHR